MRKRSSRKNIQNLKGKSLMKRKKVQAGKVIQV